MIARLCLGRCGTLIEKKGAENYCKACKPAEKPANKRYNTAEWRKISKAARKAQPWCTWCQTSKDLTVDHVLAGSMAGGIMVLCRSCNKLYRHGF